VFSVCEDFGVANVVIRGELPDQLKPALTSGCGTGITFNLLQLPTGKPPASPADRHFAPEDLFAVMEQLQRVAGEYRKSGGIHSAAVAQGRRVLLHSEDVGRHNTLDRLAGEALFKGLDLQGTALFTSGRISTEMVTKAALLGVTLIASRTSPTDLAVKLAKEAGITLVGYLRASGFNVYTYPETIFTTQAETLFSGVTAVILAGGKSTRMKSNKALLPYSGELFIERIHRQLVDKFSEVLLVTNTPELYQFLPCRMVADEYPEVGSLAGIHAGLTHSRTDKIFVVACDMPYLNMEVVRMLLTKATEADVVMPESEGGLEPLHALYDKKCLPVIEEALRNGRPRITGCFDRSRVAVVSKEAIAAIDPEFLSFRNINTPEEYFRFREEMQKKSKNGSEAGVLSHR
jgi:FdhD protein